MSSSVDLRGISRIHHTIKKEDQHQVQFIQLSALLRIADSLEQQNAIRSELYQLQSQVRTLTRIIRKLERETTRLKTE